jgi:hypothetical protein
MFEVCSHDVYCAIVYNLSTCVYIQAMAWMLEPAISMFLEGNGSFIDNSTSTTTTSANTANNGNDSRAAYSHRQQQSIEGYMFNYLHFTALL